MEISDEAYQKLILEVAAARDRPRDSWWTKFFIVAVLLILGVLTADHFKLIPQAWIDQVLPPAQTTFSTPQAPPGAPEGRAPSQVLPPHLTPFYGAPGGPEGAEATATLTTPPVPTPRPNLMPSSQGNNPGFTCGVEPGMDPNADCQDTRPDQGAGPAAIQTKSAPRRIKERGTDKVGPGGKDGD